MTDSATATLVRQLTADEVQQRVIRIPSGASGLFPKPNQLFDLWHEGQPWAARVRSEHCTCGRPPREHRHLYLEGAELHAGLRWQVGAELRFQGNEAGHIEVAGDLSP
ncbi:MAG: hypothetical protein CL928_01795 [Deltaproteobacteria bacterium]|nr:hypothetical protein [Deltaproteobacteria bacterium]